MTDGFFDNLFAAPADRQPVVRRGNRVSLLPITKYCGAAAKLSELSGSGRAALMSSWFHAHNADPTGAHTETLWRSLTDREQEECEQWSPPADVETEGGVMLRYAEAEKELEVRLRFDDGPHDIESIGHLDMGWKPIRVDGFDIVHIGDIKKQAWTSIEGPYSLQLQAYGWAYARMRGAQGYVTGIWLATEGKWLWADAPVMLDSEEAFRIREELVHAMRQRDDYAPHGVHCRDCYGRLKCPQYVLGAVDSGVWVEPLTREGADLNELDDATLRRLLLAGKAMAELGEAVVKQVHSVVDRGRLLPDPDTGKVYAPIEQRGRESALSAKALREAMGPAAEQYIKRGVPFKQHRWLKGDK